MNGKVDAEDRHRYRWSQRSTLSEHMKPVAAGYQCVTCHFLWTQKPNMVTCRCGSREVRWVNYDMWQKSRQGKTKCG